jgi:broad specificity phosphatase PhoE
MELYLVRHGQSEGNIGRTSPDPPLTELGIKQARWTALRFRGVRLNRIYASPFLRAIQTAEIIADELDMFFHLWPLLAEHEPANPACGIGRSKILSDFPRAVADEGITEDGWRKGNFQGESEEEAYERAGEVERILREEFEETDSAVLLISHGTFGAILISKLLGAPPCGYTRFSQHNCCISLIELKPGMAKLRYHNRVSHLPPEAIT